MKVKSDSIPSDPDAAAQDKAICDRGKKLLRAKGVSPAPSEVVRVDEDAILFIDSKKRAWTCHCYWSEYDETLTISDPVMGFEVRVG